MNILTRALEGEAVPPAETVNHADTSAHVEVCWQLTVVDTCSYGRLGLTVALEQYASLLGGDNIIAVDSLEDSFPLISPALEAGKSKKIQLLRCLVVRLPTVPQAALAFLLQLGELPVAHYSRVVVLSHVDPDVVRRVLLCVGVGDGVRIVDARQEPSILCQAIVLPGAGDIRGSLSEKGGSEILPCEVTHELTRRERQVLRQTLQGTPIHVQARTGHLSAKTIYSHRSNALLKLKAHNVLALLRRFLPRYSPLAGTRSMGWGR